MKPVKFLNDYHFLPKLLAFAEELDANDRR